MEFKNFEVKNLTGSDDNTISGYGAFYNNVDSYGDIILPGAFKSVSENTRSIKMLFNHSPDKVIGVWNTFTEDENGLRITGKFADTPRAQEVRELVKAGAIDSMSIGYKTIDSEYNTAGNRLLKSLELWEVSIVTFPANPLAVIDAVKAAAMTKRDIEEKLRDAGFSSSVAKKLISGGFAAISPQRDVEEANLEEIKELLRQRNLNISTI